MKSWSPFLTMSILVTIALIGCNTDPLKNAIDDFGIVIELDDINTAVAIGVYDNETKEPITDNVTLLIHPTSREHIIDMFSEPVDSVVFNGGYYNFGIRPESVPANGSTLELMAKISTEGYDDKDISISLADTGITHFEVDLLSLDNLPANMGTAEIISPTDSAGNPIPYSFEVANSNENGSNSPAKAVFQNDDPTIPLLYNIIISGNFTNLSQLEWGLIDDTNYTLLNKNGWPTAIQLTSYIWSDIPEYVKPERFSGGDNGYIETTLIIAHYGIQAKFNESDPYQYVWYVSTAEESDLPLSFGRVTADQSKAIDVLQKLGIQENGSFNFASSAISFSAYSEDTQNLYGKFIGDKDLSTLFNGRKVWSDQSPVMYTTSSTAYPDISVDIEKLLYIQAQSSMSGFNSAIAFFPYRSLFGGVVLPKSNVNLQIVGYGSSERMNVQILSGGYTVSGNETTDDGRSTVFQNVIKSNSKITVKMPEGEYSVYYDLSNYAGETITINIPSQNTNLINSTITANFVCSNPTEKLRIKKIPFATVRYKKQGTNDRPQVGSISNWNYNANTQTLNSITGTMNAVEDGQTYEVYFTVMDESNTTEVTIQGKQFSFDLPIPDEYNICSN